MKLTDHCDRLDKLIFAKVIDRNLVAEIRSHLAFIRDQIDAMERRIRKVSRFKATATKEMARLKQTHAKEIAKLKETHEHEMARTLPAAVERRNSRREGFERAGF